VAAMNPTVTVTDAPSPEAFALIGDGLNKHNRDQLGYWDQRPLAVLVCDPHTGAVLGGLTGRTSLGLAFIDLVYLPAPPRPAPRTRLRHPHPTRGRSRGTPPWLPRRRALHHHLPGARVLHLPWLGGVRPRRMRPAGHRARVLPEGLRPSRWPGRPMTGSAPLPSPPR